MEVLCERCQTEYDFDDALVSERGTTVKCTSCGHQFRIFRPKAAAAPPERWEVRTRKGENFVFVSLRELQRAITRGQVERDDVLVRDNLAPRTLSSIAELEPFFPSTLNRIPTPMPPRPEAPPRERRPTPQGLGSSPGETRALPFQPTIPAFTPAAPPRTPPPPPPPKHSSNLQTKPGLPPVTPPQAEPKLPVTASGTAILGEEPSFEPETMRRPPTAGSTVALRDLPPVEPVPPAAPPPNLVTQRIEAPQEVVIREKRDLSYTPTPSDIRAVYAAGEDARTDPRYVVPARKGSAAARWLVAFVVVGALIVGGAALGRRYLRPAASTPTTPALDPRVAEFLRTGEKALSEGDLEGAKESFDKASALAERDVRVQVQLARLANIRADIPWLKLRLLGPEQTEASAVARRDAEETSKRALQLSKLASETASTDPAAVRARVDSYRLAGDLAAARQLAPQLSSHSADPETAYVLAALDMSEANPNWTTVVDRLRQAVGADQNLGRVRGALVFALASAGQSPAAQSELETLAKAPRPHPLLVELRAFLARQPTKDAGALALAEGGIDTSSLPLAQVPGPSGEGEIAGSYQDLLARAHAARSSGDLDRAEQLYRAVLAKNPSDTEALSGLGDIARAKGDKNGSLSYYEQVQKQNPSYLPALMGLADAKWEAGDKQGAVVIYRQVLERTGGQGPYADRARQRIAAAPQGGTPAPTATPTPTTSSAPPKPTSTGTSTSTSLPPGVDTSDLPGWKPQ